MRPVKLNKKQFTIDKDGKVKRVFVARDASHVVAMKKSKKQRVVRRSI